METYKSSKEKVKDDQHIQDKSNIQKLNTLKVKATIEKRLDHSTSLKKEESASKNVECRIQRYVFQQFKGTRYVKGIKLLDPDRRAK